MTAEIGIFNRSAVALAADSAVSIGTGGKVYNTANKLFTLSKIHPVGIMVYNSALCHRLPWETLIKLFRKELGENELSTIQEYRDKFLEFLVQPRFACTQVEDAEIFREALVIAQMVLDRLRTLFMEQVGQGTAVTPATIRRDLETVIEDQLRGAEFFDFLENFGKKDVTDVLVKYADRFHDALKAVAQNSVAPNADDWIGDKFARLCAEIVCRRQSLGTSTGVVIAGFGRDELLPSMEWLQVEGFVNGRLRYYLEESLDMSRLGEAAIIRPFAQQEMVKRFIYGVDPTFRKFLDRALDDVLKGFISSTASSLAGGNTVLQDNLVKALNGANLVDNAKEGFRVACEEFQDTEFSTPILKMVQFLPKDELGNMAESLVSLTALKRKVSPEHPSVGGPVDVAIISKGDGFIWYKRKHYFDPELNPHFQNSYLRFAAPPPKIRKSRKSKP